MLEWLETYLWQLVASVTVVLLYLLLERYAAPRLEEGADDSRFRSGPASHATRLARVITGIFALLVLILVWGVELGAVVIFGTTLITLLGVALFANWSLLSNVTAFFVLLLHPSFRRGNFVRIIDADNYVEGYISDLTFFNTQLVTEKREVIVYPNNLLLGKPTIVNPRDRLDGVGKLQPVASSGVRPLASEQSPTTEVGKDRAGGQQT